MSLPNQIIIEDYSPEWALVFQELRNIYADLLGNPILDIQHVGSTSVPGLAAKPLLDIDIIISDRNNLHQIISKLQTLGYDHVGDWGIAEREAFKKKLTLVPYTDSNSERMRHNLYVCIDGSVSLRNHLALRNYLQANNGMAKKYGDLKRKLAGETPHDIDLYAKNKTPFIISILEKLGFDENELNRIRRDNGFE